MKRGTVVVAAGTGSYDAKPRPAVIVQSDRFDTIKSLTVCPLTTTEAEPSAVRIKCDPSAANGLVQRSFLMVDKLTTMRRNQVARAIGQLEPDVMRQLDTAMRLFLGLAA